MLANLAEGEGETPISSSWRTASRHSSIAILCVPTSRRVWRTPSCGRGEHQPRVLEPRRVAAEELEVRGHAPARLDLHGGQVGDLQAAVAGQARAHEEPDVVAPAGVRRLEVAELLVAALEQRAVVLGVRALPRDPLGEVDARPRPRGVDAVLDVGALALDVGLVGRAGGGADVEVAGGVDDDLGEDRAAALLALEDRAAQLVAVDDRVDDPGVQDAAARRPPRAARPTRTSATPGRSSATR